MARKQVDTVSARDFARVHHKMDLNGDGVVRPARSPRRQGRTGHTSGLDVILEECAHTDVVRMRTECSLDAHY